MTFDDARAVADAVLFEGYALYPYRASSPKNQLRWQFGVLAPRAWSEGGGGDPWWQETQCLIAPKGPAARLEGKVRFLQLRRRQTNGDVGFVPWDEGETVEIDFGFSIAALIDGEQVVPFQLEGGTDLTGELAYRKWPVFGVVRLSAALIAETTRPLVRLSVRVENVSAWVSAGAARDEALPGSLLGTHLLLAASDGAFVSLIDPPEWAAAGAAVCRNIRTYPVLAGPPARHDLLLSAPVILGDHPQVAPESPRDLFDATEIDEILTLRILTLTDDEKREMRATDQRLGKLLDSVEKLGPDEMARLHGISRELRPTHDESLGPSQLQVGGVSVGPGTRVRLRPGARRTDAQDMFLDGLTATVEAVMRDVEDRDCLAVTIDDDPAREILRWQRRFHYFSPDEIEVLDSSEGAGAA
ncbi:MAG TPA: hypothetical protein VH853_16625 [Polyangia bacterium]|nr:hypothetical protein [Polyangia bacterium]